MRINVRKIKRERCVLNERKKVKEKRGNDCIKNLGRRKFQILC